MEPVSQKELRKYFALAVVIGLALGIIYTHITSSYSKQFQVSLELLQKLEILGAQPHSKSNATVTEDDFLTIEQEISATVDNDTVLKKIPANATTKNKAQFAMADRNNRKESLEDSMMHKESQGPSSAGNMDGKTMCALDKTKLVGPLYVDRTETNLEDLKRNELSFVRPGGQWHPDHCSSTKKVALVIPFRKREKHLGIFLRHVHPILKRHNLQYRIFVIDQADEYSFNRGKLMNVGYKEAIKYAPFNCFVFHDVDLIPEDDRIDYGCPASPMHLSVAVDKFHYKLIYEQLFGGVEMFTKRHFEKVNGFSNSFWGWGAEDDNLYYRIKLYGLNLWRPSMKIARYTMLRHQNNEATADNSRHDNLRDSRQEKYVKADGLNSLQYEVIERKELPLFTLIRVNLRKHKDRMFGLNEYL